MKEKSPPIVLKIHTESQSNYFSPQNLEYVCAMCMWCVCYIPQPTKWYAPHITISLHTYICHGTICASNPCFNNRLWLLEHRNEDIICQNSKRNLNIVAKQNYFLIYASELGFNNKVNAKSLLFSFRFCHVILHPGIKFCCVMVFIWRQYVSVEENGSTYMFM